MDTIIVFGRAVPVYGVMGGIGIVLGILYLYGICRIEKARFGDAVYVLVWAGLFAILGAKLLYLLIECGNIVTLLKENPQDAARILWAYTTGGFVFYGGLGGAILGAFWACRYFSLPVREQMNRCTPILPLVHGFGRIGCHIVGCCHGIESAGPLSVMYSHSAYAPNGIALFPVQLCEAGFDFLLFAVFLLPSVRRRWKGWYLQIYLIAYSLARFVLEFFRGDLRRGLFGPFSTSQWISILIWVVLVVWFRSRLKKEQRCGHGL